MIKKNGLVSNFCNNRQKGLTILEALMATAIVGIGFVAIFQMVNYSVMSVNSSSERTKANYIVTMIAEGIIGYRDTVGGVKLNELRDIYYKNGQPYLKDSDGNEKECKKFAEYYKDLGATGGACVDAGGGDPLGSPDTGGTSVVGGDLREEKINIKSCSKARHANADAVTPIHGSTAQKFEDAPRNKIIKWLRILTENRVVKCRSKKDFRSIKIFEQSPWGNADITNDRITDNKLYIGRIQINMNDGKKRKYVYFQADYNLKQD